MIAFKAETSAPLQRQIAEHLASRIISGELPDQSRLPSTRELAQFYGVTPVTVHKSLQHLVRRQLIERQPRLGTFVRSRDRVNVIALVFGKNPFLDQSHLYSHLLDQFQKQAPERNFNLKVYFDFDECSRTKFDLQQDILSGELKGIVAANRTPGLSEFLAKQSEIAWSESIRFDYYQSVRRGVEYLLGRGYRNLLVVSMLPEELPYPDFREHFDNERRGAEDAVKGSGATLSVVRWGQKEIDGYEKCKQLLSGKQQLPDAILVNHDVFTRGLLMALLEYGLKIPRDIAILSHMNYGCEFASPVELTRLEVRAADVVSGCLDSLTGAIARHEAGHIALPDTIARLVPGKSCGE